MQEVLIAGGGPGIEVSCKTCKMLLAHEGDHVIKVYGALVMGPEGYGIRCPVCGDVKPWQVPGITGPGEFKTIKRLSQEMQNAVASVVCGYRAQTESIKALDNLIQPYAGPFLSEGKGKPWPVKRKRGRKR